MIVEVPNPFELRLVCREPETTREVLEFRVWIRCLEDVARKRHAVAGWLAAHVVSPDVDALTFVGLATELEAGDDPDEGWTWLHWACETLCQRAELPKARLDGMLALLDRQCGIDPEWHPATACDCGWCMQYVPTDQALPEGMTCLYADRDVVDLVIASAGLESIDDPYWLTQCRGVHRQAEGRRLAHEREKRDDEPRLQKEWADRQARLAAALTGVH